MDALVHGGEYNGVICMSGGGMNCMMGQFTTRWAGGGVDGGGGNHAFIGGCMGAGNWRVVGG